VRVAAAAVGVVGAIFILQGALKLFFGIHPDDPRYKTAPLRNQGLANLLHDQRRINALLLIGASIQVLATILALFG
jgi:hypothetical protein